jgi:hypothetical protein
MGRANSFVVYPTWPSLVWRNDAQSAGIGFGAKLEFRTPLLVDRCRAGLPLGRPKRIAGAGQEPRSLRRLRAVKSRVRLRLSSQRGGYAAGDQRPPSALVRPPCRKIPCRTRPPRRSSTRSGLNSKANRAWTPWHGRADSLTAGPDHRTRRRDADVRSNTASTCISCSHRCSTRTVSTLRISNIHEDHSTDDGEGTPNSAMSAERFNQFGAQ